MPNSDVDQFRMFIGGAFTDASDGAVLSSFDPYTGHQIADFPDATGEDVERAIESARDAFESLWRETPGVERARLLHRLADLFDDHAEEFAVLESRDNGKLVRETRTQMRFCARSYRWFAGYADKIYGRTIPLDSPGIFDYTRTEPVGVAALITAWNSPMQLLANKLAPALAAGNCVVIKPSEQASLTTLKLGELIAQAGFPAGVVSIITGGPRTGAALTSHPRLDRISFTGSVPVGQAIAAAAAKTLVPVTLELGGKSANIVFDDADLPRALNGAIAGIFAAGGQTCIAGSRLLVQDGIYDDVVKDLADRASTIRLGDPRAADTQMGPVANLPQYERISAAIAKGLESGAQRVAGGGDITGMPDGSLFVRPTIFADVDNRSTLAREEIFGPVLSIIRFSDVDEAVALANDSDFGLASAVWTENLARAHTVAARLDAGTVWVNTYRAAAVQAPFGGIGKSGYGRERGEEALHDYVRTKNVMIDLSRDERDPFAIRT